MALEPFSKLMSRLMYAKYPEEKAAVIASIVHAKHVEVKRDPEGAAVNDPNVNPFAHVVNLVEKNLCNVESAGYLMQKCYLDKQVITDIALRVGCMEAVLLMIEAGAGVNKLTPNNKCELLVAAASWDSYAGAEILIQAGADVNSLFQNNWTLLMIAAGNGFDKCVNLFIQNGVNVTAIDVYGHTAMMISAYNGHHKCLESLIRAGADVNVTGNLGETALMVAARYGSSTELVRMLLEAGARVNQTDTNGRNALTTHAVESEKLNKTLLMLLVEAGKRLYILNALKFRETMLMLETNRSGKKGTKSSTFIKVPEYLFPYCSNTIIEPAKELENVNGDSSIVPPRSNTGADLNISNTGADVNSSNTGADVNETLGTQSGKKDTKNKVIAANNLGSHVNGAVVDTNTKSGSEVAGMNITVIAEVHSEPKARGADVNTTGDSACPTSGLRERDAVAITPTAGKHAATDPEETPVNSGADANSIFIEECKGTNHTCCEPIKSTRCVLI